MSFDRRELAEAVVRHGRVARVVVADARGSVPREPGAAMLVMPDGETGTIRGGALEFEAISRARAALSSGGDRADRIPLGPGLGQCCGGSVTLLTEIWTAERLDRIEGEVVARPLPGTTADVPLAVSKLLAAARATGALPEARIVDNWMVEPIRHATREIWVWGAGHVGRAIVAVLAPLPGLDIRWADSAEERFPENPPEGAERLIATNPADLVTLSGPAAEHLVLTYSHALDLEICHRVLGRPFRSLGLIGSATKRARFRSRLKALGHTEAQIARIVCPIGDPSLGKHPQAIALGVAADIVRSGTGDTAMLGERA